MKEKWLDASFEALSYMSSETLSQNTSDKQNT